MQKGAAGLYFVVTSGRILALRDEVKSTAISLKEQKETAKSRRLHESQNFAHNAHMDMGNINTFRF